MSQVRSPGQIIDVRIDQRAHYITSLYLDLVIVTLTLAVDGHWYPPQPAEDQTSKRLSHSSDSSIALFTLYLRISEEHDRRKYELLKGELDSILVFVSHYVCLPPCLITIYSENIVRFVFRHSCGIVNAIDPASGGRPGLLLLHYHGPFKYHKFHTIHTTHNITPKLHRRRTTIL